VTLTAILMELKVNTCRYVKQTALCEQAVQTIEHKSAAELN